MKRILVPEITQPASNINSVVLIRLNAFRNHGFVMDRKIVLMDLTNLTLVNSKSVRPMNSNARINVVNLENSVVITMMIVVITRMKMNVENTDVHLENGIVLVLGIVLIN